MNKIVERTVVKRYHYPMKNKGVALVEIVVSMIVLAVAALAVTSTVSMVNSKQLRSAGGSSLDVQALSYARETLESLKNSVSTNDTTGSLGEKLKVSGTAYNVTIGLPAGFSRTYTVSDVGGGTGLKKVKVTVQWND